MTFYNSEGVPTTETEAKWFLKDATYKVIARFEDPKRARDSDLQLGELLLFLRADYGRYENATRYTFKRVNPKSNQDLMASFLIHDSTPIPKWGKFFQKIGLLQKCSEFLKRRFKE